MKPIVILVISLLVMESCNNSISDKSKSNDSTIGSKASAVSVDTAAKHRALVGYLASRKMSELPMTDIPAGTTVTIPGTSVYYPVLNMGDGSKLIIPANYPRCEILIGQGIFGQGTEIVADGVNGSNGVTAKGEWELHGWWQATENGDGINGPDGTAGSPGTPAVDSVIIQCGLQSIGTLNIHANGGRGGNGGGGARGQMGGNKGALIGHDGDGGNGGIAWRGSSGGDGGHIVFQVWPAGDSTALPGMMQHVSLLALGGLKGVDGVPGAPGRAGRDNGNPGNFGPIKGFGSKGLDGRTSLQPISRPQLP